MFCIFCDITGFQQLKKVDRKLYEKLENEILSICTQYGGVPFKREFGLYSFSTRFKESYIRIIDAAFEIKSYLDSIESKLWGYTIILSAGEESYDWWKEQLDYLLFQTFEENQIWLNLKDYDDLSELVELEKELNIYRIMKRKKNNPMLHERVDNLRLSRTLNDTIKNKLSLLRKGKFKPIVVSGPQFSGKRSNFIPALVESFELPMDEWVLVETNASITSSYTPFINSLNINIIEEHLKDDEYSDPRWKLLADLYNRGRFHSASDCFQIDFTEAYMLYIKELVSKSYKNSKPFIMICDSPERLSDLDIKLLRRIIDRLSFSENGYFAAITERNTINKNIWGDKWEIISISALSKTEAKRRCGISFPGLTLSAEEWSSLQEDGPILPVKLFHILLVHEQSGTDLGHNTLNRLISSKSEIMKQQLWLIGAAENLIKQSEILTFLKIQIGEEESSSFHEYFERLADLELIHKDQFGNLKLLFPEIMTILEKDENINIESLKIDFSDYLYRIYEKEDSIDHLRLFRLFRDFGQFERSMELLYKVIDHLLNNREYEDAEYILENELYISDNSELDPKIQEELKDIVYAARLRISMRDGNLIETNELISRGDISLIASQGPYSDSLVLQKARYYYAQKDSNGALSFSKEALFSFQKKGDHIGESAANIQLALALLSQKKIQAATDHFEIARRISYQVGDNYNHLKALSLEAVGNFLFGNISNAERIIDSAISLSKSFSRRDREVYLIFFKGRILFDSGDFSGAAEYFEEGERIASTYKLERASDVNRLWNARALIYNEDFGNGEVILNRCQNCAEKIFFLAESCAFQRDKRNALRIAKEASELNRTNEVHIAEDEMWHDGYQVIEGLLTDREGEENVLSMEIRALTYWLEGEIGDLSVADDGFFHLFREENSPFKPYIYKYYYYYSLVVGKGESGRGDKKLKYLSQAVNKLQSRAGRFDDQQRKYAFLHKNYWNSKIMDEAQKKKFI